MTTAEPPLHEGSPNLGYMSLAQLQEYAVEHNWSGEPRNSITSASRLFLSVLRRADTDGLWGGAELSKQVGEEDKMESLSETDLFNDKFINLDTLFFMLKGGYLAAKHPSESYARERTQVGAKGIELVQAYVVDRAYYLGRQPAHFVVS